MNITQFFSKQSTKRTFGLLVLAIVIWRLPFTLNMFGYGLDDDAWRIALAARKIAETKMYSYSRLPGYPLVEILFSVFVGFGPVATNILTAIVGAIGVGFFYLTLKELEIKNSFIWAFLFAATPIIHIYSTTSMDYIWALSFTLIGLFFVYRNKPLLAGAFLGAAIGSRITSGALILVFSGLLWIRYRDFKALQKFVLSTLVVGGLFYIPIFLQKGFSFFDFYDIGSYPGFKRLIGMISVNVWGHLGSAALILWGIYFMIYLLFKKDKSRKLSFEEGLWFFAIAIYIISWLRLPLSAGYLIPTIPFVYLFLARYSGKKMLWVFSILLLFSGFIKVKPFQIEPGMILEETSLRREQVETIDKLYDHFSTLDSPALVYMRSDWTVYMRLKMPPDHSDYLLFEIFPSEDVLKNYIERGYIIYYEENSTGYFLRNTGIDFRIYEANPFSISEIVDSSH